MRNVAVLDDYQRRAREWADWQSLGSEIEVSFFHDRLDQQAMAEQLAAFEIVVSLRKYTEISRQTLDALPNLQLLVVAGSEFAPLESTDVAGRGLVVADLRRRNDPPSGGQGSTAELAWSLIFALAKRTVIEDRALRAGSWQIGCPSNLAGKTLGIIGLGRLGSQMVGVARAFGMGVIAWSPHLTAERAQQSGAEYRSLDALLGESDIVTIHLVLSDTTRGLLGAREFAKMKSDAVLINTSRGPIVDESALIEALRTHRIAGAGLDVYDREPLIQDHPLLSLENTVLSPHVGHVTEIGLQAMYRQAVRAIGEFLAGTVPPNSATR